MATTVLGVDSSRSYSHGKAEEESVWHHTGTILGFEYRKVCGGQIVEHDARIFVTSLQRDRLTTTQWLLLVLEDLLLGKSDVSTEERHTRRQQLLDLCERDTLAIVKLVERLKGHSSIAVDRR